MQELAAYMGKLSWWEKSKVATYWQVQSLIASSSPPPKKKGLESNVLDLMPTWIAVNHLFMLCILTTIFRGLYSYLTSSLECAVSHLFKENQLITRFIHVGWGGGGIYIPLVVDTYQPCAVVRTVVSVCYRCMLYRVNSYACSAAKERRPGQLGLEKSFFI